MTVCTEYSIAKQINRSFIMKDKELTLSRRVFILSAGSVTGQKEKNGPLGKLFDISGDDKFGKDTWEKSEAEMQRLALRIALNKSGISENDIDALFAGDLINQCISSSFGLISFNIPFLGLFGACSTAAEGMIMSAVYASSVWQKMRFRDVIPLLLSRKTVQISPRIRRSATSYSSVDRDGSGGVCVFFRPERHYLVPI